MSIGLKINLDDTESLRTFDLSSCHTSINNFALQLQTAWQDAENINFEGINQNSISSVYFCGMGGSAYAGRIARFLFRDSLKVPFEIVDNYNLPAAVDNNSLIFCASYSGNTQETLSCAHAAIARGSNVVGVTQGGELGELFRENNKPVYFFDAKLNPSQQPRLGQGYMIASSLSILNKLNLINVDKTDLEESYQELKKRSSTLNWDCPSAKNQAKSLALESESRLMFFIAADFLEGTIHAVRNPINETGKHFCSYFILPELNHHLLEGLAFPLNLKESIVFILINSSNYPDKIQKRFALTKEVIAKNGINILEINLNSKTRFQQTFELIQLLSYFSFYLAALHGINPAPVPWVDYFKNSLSR